MPPKKATTSRGGYSHSNTTKKHTTPYIPKKIVGISGYGCQIDVIFAIVLLRNTKEYKYTDVKFVYTKEDMEKCDIILGFGGKYDPQNNIYDYHQKNFNEYFDETISTKCTMTTASMIFKKFANKIIYNSISEFHRQRYEIHSVTEELVNRTKYFFYEKCLEGIDAVLNGHEIFEHDDTHPLLFFDGTESQCIVPDYCHSIHDIYVAIDKYRSVFFSSFESSLECAAKYPKIKKAAEEALQRKNPLEKRILFVDTMIESYLVRKVEESLHCDTKFLFIVREYNGVFTCRAVSESHLNERALFPVEWRGKENDELIAVVGDKNVKFCHQSGFLLQCLSYDCAKKLTLIAVENYS